MPVASAALELSEIRLFLEEIGRRIYEEFSDLADHASHRALLGLTAHVGRNHRVTYFEPLYEWSGDAFNQRLEKIKRLIACDRPEAEVITLISDIQGRIHEYGLRGVFFV